MKPMVRPVSGHVSQTADLAAFRKLLMEEAGLAFDEARPELLRAGLAERMARRQISALPEYFELVRNSAEGHTELKALIDLLTIGETYFFRNPAHFAVIRERLLPALAAERQGAAREIRVWSAACSTGEEPYSLAMMLEECLPDRGSWHISILATDINRIHLAKAAEGVYGARSVKYVPQEWLHKYFVRQGDRYHLDARLKRKVRFEQHNLAKGPFDQSEMTDVDLLFCRNVVIYFDFDTIRKVMDRFSQSVRPTGYLFMGEAETLWNISDRFTPVEFPGCFLYQRNDAAGGADAGTGTSDGGSVPSEPPVIPALVDLPELTTLLLHQDPPPTAPLTAAPVAAPTPQKTSTQLELASALADQGRHEDAIPLLQEAVRSDSLSSSAYYLLGVVYQKLGKSEDAASAFQKALYVDPGLALAHFELGNLYQSQGRSGHAQRAFANALKALEGVEEDSAVVFSADITAGYLRHACQHRLDTLQKPKGSS